VSDVRLYRQGIGHALERQSSVTVVGSADGPESGLACLSELQVDVVAFDIAMPEALEFARTARLLVPAVKCVAFAVSDIDRDLLACAAAGIDAFVSRDASIDELAAAIEACLVGELRCSARVAGSLYRQLAALAADRPARRAASELTAREAEIARLIRRGLSNKQIAVELGIEVATVKNHVHNILEKLCVHRRSDVQRHAQPIGYLS
jgi:DNA-binding NarL/FixJ family response regulator